MATEEYEEPMGEEEVVSEEPASDFDTFGAEALGISLDDPDARMRLDALKEFVHACLEQGYDDKGKGGGKPKPAEKDSGLALIFGKGA